jgi:hypothetical protein
MASTMAKVESKAFFVPACCLPQPTICDDIIVGYLMVDGGFCLCLYFYDIVTYGRVQ